MINLLVCATYKLNLHNAQPAGTHHLLRSIDRKIEVASEIHISMIGGIN